jgi:serine/threonine protein kinase
MCHQKYCVSSLGKGAFGFVRAIKHRRTGCIYAVKCIKYGSTVDLGQNLSTQAEYRAMREVHHVSY